MDDQEKSKMEKMEYECKLAFTICKIYKSINCFILINWKEFKMVIQVMKEIAEASTM